jgi:hypothetical protein
MGALLFRGTRLDVNRGAGGGTSEFLTLIGARVS